MSIIKKLADQDYVVEKVTEIVTSNPDLKGEKGDKGDTGLAGYTPVKGIDYWTDTDKTDMLNDVLAALPTWNGGSY